MQQSPPPRKPSPELAALESASNERAQLAIMLQESIARAEQAAEAANRERSLLMEEQRKASEAANRERMIMLDEQRAASQTAAQERQMLMEAISSIRASISTSQPLFPPPPPLVVNTLSQQPADASFVELTAELARGRRQGTKICVSNDMGEQLGVEDAAVLADYFPVYAWPKEDKASGTLTRALVHLAAAARIIVVQGKKSFLSVLSTKMAALGRWATVEQAAYHVCLRRGGVS